MKKIIFTGAMLATTLLTACGGGSSSSSPDTTFDVELTNVELGVDSNAPVTVNHRIPLSFTIVGTSNDSSTVKDVPVSFIFVENDPLDPDAPRICESNAIDVEVVGNGQPQTIDDEYIWPVSECADLATEGKDVTLTVEFFLDGEPMQGTVSAELPTLALRNGGVDVEYELTTQSSVALIPFTSTGESDSPILSVQSSFVLNGRDPYYSVVDPSEIPDDLRVDEPDIDEQMTFGFDQAALETLDDLPAAATLTYVLIPQSDKSREFPLAIGQADGSTAAAFEINTIAQGIANYFAHDLFLEGDNLAALSDGGGFVGETNFIVRGCVTTAFTQDGNADTFSNDCEQVDVVMARETAQVTAASEITFNRELRRSPRNRRIGINSVMSTENSLSRNGAFSSSEGKIQLSGKIGRSFNMTIAQASAVAELSQQGAFYEAQVTAFDKVLFSRSDEKESGLLIEDSFSVDKDVQVAQLGFGFGPLRFGFTMRAGGRVGLDSADELALVLVEADCQDLLSITDAISSCARMSRTVTPNFAITGKVSGGFKTRRIRVGVKADLDFVNTSFPLDNTLAFGLTDDARFLVNGNVNWDTELQLISGKVKLVGSIKIFRKRRSRSVHLFSFSSKPVTLNLLNRSSGTSVELL